MNTSSSPNTINNNQGFSSTSSDKLLRKKNKVLLIEDSETFALMLKSHIENSYGHCVIVAKSLSESQTLLERNAEQYFAAVVDLHLPDAQDGEALDLVLEHEVAAIVYTGKFSEALREDILNKGVTDYVLKQDHQGVEYVSALVDRIYKNYSTKVLIVDDSRIARRSMSRLLKTQRYQTLEAASGTEALALLDKNPEIKIALLDCFMDPMDGFTLAGKIRMTHSKEELAIIGVSSQGGQALSAKFIKSGANDFLIKPFLPEEFNCRINQNADFVDNFNALTQSNEQKNILLGIAAHDIRGPLSVLHHVADLLARKDLNAERRQQLYEMIQQNTSHMLDLLNRLLDISAIESGNFSMRKSLNKISTLIEQRVTFYNNLADEKSQKITCNLENIPAFCFDSVRISEVLDNLITNAIKYAPKETDITLNLKLQDDRVKFSVKDQGPGIAANEVSLLFGAFQKTSNTTTGGEQSTGLGLAISKSIANAHQGTIYYKPNPEGGSCFTLLLPFENAKTSSTRKKI